MIRKIIFTPIISKIVTLSELKNSYTLKDFIDLMSTGGEFMENLTRDIGK